MIGLCSRLIHDAQSAWRRGRIESEFRHQLWAIQRGVRHQLGVFRAQVKGLKALEATAMQAAADTPWAAEFVAHQLRRRMDDLREVPLGGDSDEVASEEIEQENTQ